MRQPLRLLLLFLNVAVEGLQRPSFLKILKYPPLAPGHWRFIIDKKPILAPKLTINNEGRHFLKPYFFKLSFPQLKISSDKILHFLKIYLYELCYERPPDFCFQ
jgi:hypothetical protein